MRTFPVIFLTITLLGGSLPGRLPAREVEPLVAETLQEQAETLLQALVDGNLETVVEMTYSGLIQRYDTEEMFLEEVRMLTRQMEKTGLMPVGFETEPPTEMVEAGEEIHAVVPYTMILESETQKVRATSFLLAIQSPLSANWTFLDGRGLNKAGREILLKNFNAALQLPAPEDLSIENIEDPPPSEEPE